METRRSREEPKGAVFLDRDGVINEKAPEGDYVKSPGELKVLPGVGRAIRRLNGAGLPVIVVTNQRGVSRGLMSEEDLEAVHQRLADELAKESAALDGIYACVHGYEDRCDCRKPRPGLLLRAAEERGLDLSESWMVGDRESDVKAGLAAGCQTILLTANAERARSVETAARWVVRDLGAAVDRILEAAEAVDLASRVR